MTKKNETDADVLNWDLCIGCIERTMRECKRLGFHGVEVAHISYITQAKTYRDSGKRWINVIHGIKNLSEECCEDCNFKLEMMTLKKENKDGFSDDISGKDKE